MLLNIFFLVILFFCLYFDLGIFTDLLFILLIFTSTVLYQLLNPSVELYIFIAIFLPQFKESLFCLFIYLFLYFSSPVKCFILLSILLNILIILIAE